VHLWKRIAGVVLAVIGLLGLAGSFDVNKQGHRPLELIPIFLLILAAAVFLFVRGQRGSTRDRRVALEKELLYLAQPSGTLTVAQVIARMSLTSDEAKAALVQLEADGLAEFDVDAEGMPLYRVRKVPPPGK
jgi:hypothetical protein